MDSDRRVHARTNLANGHVVGAPIVAGVRVCVRFAIDLVLEYYAGHQQRAHETAMACMVQRNGTRLRRRLSSHLIFN